MIDFWPNSFKGESLQGLKLTFIPSFPQFPYGKVVFSKTMIPRVERSECIYVSLGSADMTTQRQEDVVLVASSSCKDNQGERLKECKEMSRLFMGLFPDLQQPIRLLLWRQDLKVQASHRRTGQWDYISHACAHTHTYAHTHSVRYRRDNRYLRECVVFLCVCGRTKPHRSG